MIDSHLGPVRRLAALAVTGPMVLGAALLACSATAQRTATGTGGSSGATGSTGTSHPSGTTGAGGSSPTNASSGSGGSHGPCDILCATEAMVTCPKTATTGCSAACVFAETEVTWCTAIAAASTECLAKEPASSFACDTNQETAPKSGVCTSELTAIQSCWDSGPPGGLPDLSQACSDACAKQASLSCADPTCTADCEANLEPGVKCNGAFAAGVACAAKQAASDFACDTETPPRPNLNAGICAFEAVLLGTCLQAM